MYKLTLWYSIQSGGDGSAYPYFMESEKLTEFDQENMDETWGETCNGSITLMSESEIITEDRIVTKESYYIELLENVYDKWDKKRIKKFIEEFFFDEIPIFTVSYHQEKYDKGKYAEYYVYDSSGKLCHKTIERYEDYETKKTRTKEEVIKALTKTYSNGDEDE